MRWLERLIPPPLAMLIVGAAMWAATRRQAPLDMPYAARFGLGWVLFLAGLAIAATGAMTFRRAGASIDPRRVDKGEVLVTHGVFRLTRNPMYLGAAVALCGWAVMLARPWALLGPVVFVLFIAMFQIAPEERAMRGKFGDAYEAYRRRTRRWL